eukprot:TRINITY_DN365_c0_g1_i1.p1 TRINITY_DN365_c0_g1~~TRINITY_DN365_c0_g1_i1.p1  ORF type:complete len:1122 (+),score=271.13 TRINITY_DN365_c0_g1_i1:75-3368(+)
MSDPQAQFEGLLSNLLSPENAARTQAEKVYMNTKKKQPNEVVQALLQVSRNSTSVELRSLAIVLLRRTMVNVEKDNTLWSKLNPEVQQLVKDQLLIGVEREEDPKVRSGFCEAATLLATELFDSDDQWQGFNEWLMRLAQGTQEHHRESTFDILTNVAHVLHATFEGAQFPILQQLLLSGYNSPRIALKLGALSATVSFIPVFSKKEFRLALQSLLAPMLDVIAFCLNSHDEDNAQEGIRLFVSLAEQDPGFFKPAIENVINAMLKIATTAQLEPDTRRLSVEFMVEIVENKPGMAKKTENFLKHLIYTLLQWMLDIPEITLEEWNARGENDDDEVDIENCIIAEESLDRICLVLGGEVVVPIIFEHIPNMATNPDWKQRYVSMMSLSMIGEGCRDVLKPHLDKVIGLLLPLFHDPHPRVRWAAANTAGQMSTDFGPHLQKKYHADFLPRFIHLLEDHQNPKVQSHVAAALVNFSEKFDALTLVPYLNQLLNKLLYLLKNGSTKHVQETALTAVGSLAGCAGKHFAEYYNLFMPIMKEILSSTAESDPGMLRGKAIECITLIGVAVGKEVFIKDAGPLMELLLSFKTSDLEPDDPLRDFILQAWIRISSCLGSDFVPYLKFAMPHVMNSAMIDCNFSVSDSSLLTTEDDEEPGWEIVDVGDTRIKIHTLALEEKANACSLIHTFACEMKDEFFPYVSDVSKIIAPLLTFYFHDGVRCACLSMVPHLLNSVKLYNEKHKLITPHLVDLFRFLYPPLLDSFKGETELDVLVTAVEALHGSLTVMGPGTIPPDEVQNLMSETVKLVQESIQRRQELLDSNPDGDEDDSILVKEETSKEDELLRELAEVVGALVKNQPQVFVEAFKTGLCPLVGNLIQKNRPAAERQLALCIFDDLVEHAKADSFPFWDSFMPFMLEYATDPNPEVRQASCYGLGVCAQQGLERFRPYTRQVLALLISVITKPDSREDRNAPPTENAISSVGKIIHYQAEELGSDVPELMKMWLNWLPLQVDDIEAQAVHEHLFSFIMSNHPHIFGQDFANLPKILSLFAFLLIEREEPLVKDKAVIKVILTQMQQQMPAELLARAFAVLSKDEQASLQNL